MANAIVKVTDIVHGEVDKDSLLLLVGEDGSVTPDRNTVDNFLSAKSGPTNIQIMQIDKIGQKGIDVIVDNVTYLPDMEVVNEEDVVTTPDDLNLVAINLYNIKLDHDYTPLTYTEKPSPKVEEDDLAEKLNKLHGNDESQILPPPPPLAKTSVRNKSITIISTYTIPPPESPTAISASPDSKKQDNGPEQQPPDVEKSAPVIEKTTPVKGKAKILHSAPKQIVRSTKNLEPKVVVEKVPDEEIEDDEEDSDLEEEEEEEDEEDESTNEDEDESEDEDFRLELEEDENDSDFEIKQEEHKEKKRVSSRSFTKNEKETDKGKHDPAKISITRRLRSRSTNMETPIETPKDTVKKAGKLPQEEKSTPEPKASEPKPTESKPTEPKPTEPKSSEPKPSEPKLSEPKSAEITTKINPETEEVKPEEVKPPEKKPQKKKKEPPKIIPGDFALFSTPDIIRKVGGKDASVPATPETPTTSKVLKSTPVVENGKPTATPKLETPAKPAKVSQESRSKSVSESPKSRISLDEKEKSVEKEKQKTSANAKTNDRRESIDKTKPRTMVEEKSNTLKTHTREKSTVERKLSSSENERRVSKTGSSSTKHDQSSLKQSKHSSDILDSAPPPSAEDLRATILSEDTKSYTTNTLTIPPSTIQASNSNTDETSSLSLDTSGLELDQSILDNLNNDEISEDILYQVARQLVTNTDIQNAIDKGINEGVLDTSSLDDTMDVSHTSQNTSGSEQTKPDIIKEGTQIIRPDGSVLILPPIERPATRSRNKRKELTADKTNTPSAKPSFKTVHKPLDEEHVSGNELDSSDDEEESEDDPNKLWCICNQPHNNRFMICCDTCEEWYHGKCVNITKAMGQQMESEGKEWICLFCKDPVKKRPLAAARRIRKASKHSRRSTDSNSSTKKGEQTKAVSVPCVVCQKDARKNSIYCSETCILTHAQGIEKVVVFERSSGKMLTGSKAPSAGNLDQWLKEHPGYEVVKSGGKMLTTKVKSTSQLTQSKLKLVKNKNNEGVSLAVQQRGVNIGVLKHGPKHTGQIKQGRVLKIPQMFMKDASKESKIKLIQAQPLTQVIKQKEQTPKKTIQTTLTSKVSTTSSPKITPKKETPKEKVKTPKSKPKEEQSTPTPKKEDIRDVVQKTVCEQLIIRLKGSDIKLTDEQVKAISVEIEAELYKCFGDTGQKYKNKYRSLIFNVKDPKNQTLWRRICEKTISSYQLVRLSPDDMASQELAQWREQEAKHQLDMIKKSEIDLLNCNRQYVLKTHKGEEVLEDHRAGTKTDNSDIIKSLTEGSSLETPDSKRNTSKDRDKDNKKNISKHSKDRHSSRDRRRRSRSRNRKRSRSRDRSRYDKRKKDKHSKSRSKSRDRSKDRDKNKDRDRHRKSTTHKSSRYKKEDIISSTDSLDKRSKEILEQLNKIAPPLEERLWKHVPQEDIVPHIGPDSDSDHEVPSSTVTIPTPPPVQDTEDIASFSSEESKSSRFKMDIDDEGGLSPPPKTTIPQIWSGTINMVDVAKISISAHEVSGDCSGLNRELTENLDIVGRISPDTVWDYIGKMRSSNSKIISLIRLNATNQEEQMPYLALYSYLSSRNRLGVVKSTNKGIKDFYILPLAAQKPIPQALLPISGPVRQWLESSVKKINDRVQNGFEEARPALLLGIIVRDRRKRIYPDSVVSTPTPPKKTKIEIHVVRKQPARSYTPPPMPADDETSPPPPQPPPPPPQSVKLDPRLAKFQPPPPPVPEAAPQPPPPSLSPPGIPKLTPSMLNIVKPALSSTSMKTSSTTTIPTSTPTKPTNAVVEIINDEDEPYSPGDSDPDTTVTETPSSTAVLTAAATIVESESAKTSETYTPIPGLGNLPVSKMDMQRQMEELNKKIEMQKSEITSITKNLAAEKEIVGSALANIALPSNLQQILDSIKTIGNTPAESNEATPADSPAPPSQSIPATIDLTIPLMIPKTFSRPLVSAPPPVLLPNMSVPPPDLNTIPLNLPLKPKVTPSSISSPTSSVLSSLSEEELIKKAAEMLSDDSGGKSKDKKAELRTPRPPPISFSINKKKKDLSLPPVPGIDD